MVFIVAIWTFIAFSNLNFSTTTAIARYLLISNKVKMTFKHFVLAILFTISFPFLLSTNFYFAFDLTIPSSILSSNRIEIIGNDSMFDDTNLVNAIVDCYSNIHTFLNLLGFEVNLVVSSIITYITYKKYSSFEKKYSSQLDDRTKRMNNQFKKLFVLQSTLPLVFIGIPVCMYITFILLEVHTNMGTYIITLMGLNPSINGILFLTLVSKNRSILFCHYQYVKNKLFCCCFKKSNVAVGQNKAVISRIM
uniref:G_PROTEIN_RECEP_F1_2 domain-containing protein n=1 Tax=Rhabditophanes sp. KR3021 TaxID=114890 RepID=A0AC35UF04_9BILA